MNPFLLSSYFNLEENPFPSLLIGTQEPWAPLNLLSDFLSSQQLGKIDMEIPEGVHLVNPEQISIGEGTVVEPGAYIRGPCIIGKNCTIRHGAYIRGFFVAGDECIIGHTTEVKNSIFLKKTCASHFAYIGDSILGNEVNLGAGVKCANLRLAGDELQVRWEGKLYPTGRRKLGAIIGDWVQIGCNAVTNPGTFIGKDARWFPGVTFGGIIPPKTTVKPSTKPEIAVLQPR